MSRIVVSNCWSFYNKGDAAIAIATVNTIHKVIPDAKVTLLAVDNQSFIEHPSAFDHKIDIYPMAHVITPFRQIFSAYSILGYPGRGVMSFIGILYLIVQLLLFPVIRRVNESFNKMLTEIDSADLIVGVGGNYLYANKSFFNHILILSYGKFIRKKKILLLGHSIGPFDDRISKFIAKKLLENVDFVVFRENMSKNYIRQNITDEFQHSVSGDAAFLLSHQGSKKIERKSEKNRIGISIRRWFHRNPKIFHNYLDAAKEAIISLAKRNYDVFIVPFSYIEGTEDDIELCNSVYQEIPEDLRKNVHLLNLKKMTPSEIISSLIELEFDAFIATRLHSAILASLSNIPSLIISYQHFKAYGISRQLGLEEYVVNIGKVTFDGLNTSISNILQNSESLKNKVINSTKKIREKTLADYSSIVCKMVER
jgi:colanic acid/amylovoran biosynthesis protein